MRASVNEMEIDYDLSGPLGAPMVMLSHSLATTRDMWKPQLPALTKEYRVLNYDMRGHGSTSAPAGPYTFAMLTADVAGLLDHLRIERVSFVGLSIGGMIGQHLAIHHRDRLRCAVLCSTTSAIPPAAHPDAMEWIGGMIRNTPVAGFVGCGRAIQGLDITAELSKIRTPVLVLPGEKDPGAPPAMSEVIHRAIPGSEYAVLPDAAHLANIEQESAFSRVVTEFLARHR